MYYNFKVILGYIKKSKCQHGLHETPPQGEERERGQQSPKWIPNLTISPISPSESEGSNCSHSRQDLALLMQWEAVAPNQQRHGRSRSRFLRCDAHTVDRAQALTRPERRARLFQRASWVWFQLLCSLASTQ